MGENVNFTYFKLGKVKPKLSDKRIKEREELIKLRNKLGIPKL